jgi:hypothetical protein
MGFAEIIAFFKALPEIIKILGEINNTLKQLQKEAIEKELALIRSEVKETLTKIEKANTHEERKILALELATRISK